jgi:hypothetical protein
LRRNLQGRHACAIRRVNRGIVFQQQREDVMELDSGAAVAYSTLT